MTKIVAVQIPSNILNGIFDECDKYDDAETGGRLLGFVNKNIIEVRALIGPGPKAKRTAVSLFQDGDYQEQCFRGIEKHYPNIRHLGNWHTHHCNGLEALSNGDAQTYHKTVNSPKHAQDFFYALLVTKKTANWGSSRYLMKHYIFFRGEDSFVQLDDSQVCITQPSTLRIPT